MTLNSQLYKLNYLTYGYIYFLKIICYVIDYLLLQSVIVQHYIFQIVTLLSYVSVSYDYDIS